MFPPKSPFQALFGAFYPHPAHNPRCERKGLLTSWHPVNVGAPPSPWPLFSRLPPHAAVRRDQPGQAMSRPFPAGYCLMPTPELGKERAESDLDDRPLSIRNGRSGGRDDATRVVLVPTPVRLAAMTVPRRPVPAAGRSSALRAASVSYVQGGKKRNRALIPRNQPKKTIEFNHTRVTINSACLCPAFWGLATRPAGTRTYFPAPEESDHRHWPRSLSENSPLADVSPC